jgi:hypothetical protein
MKTFDRTKRITMGLSEEAIYKIRYVFYFGAACGIVGSAVFLWVGIQEHDSDFFFISCFMFLAGLWVIRIMRSIKRSIEGKHDKNDIDM